MFNKFLYGLERFGCFRAPLGPPMKQSIQGSRLLRDNRSGVTLKKDSIHNLLNDLLACSDNIFLYMSKFPFVDQKSFAETVFSFASTGFPRALSSTICLDRISICLDRIPLCFAEYHLLRQASICQDRIPICLDRIPICLGRIPIWTMSQVYTNQKRL